MTARDLEIDDGKIRAPQGRQKTRENLVFLPGWALKR
jgi:hypothetical protein